MKKQNIIFSIIAVIAVLVAGYFITVNLVEQKTQISNLKSESQSLSEILHERDSLINEMMIAFNEIEGDLESIHKKKNIISLNAEDGEISNNKKTKITRDIQAINSLLEANENKIAALNRQLKNSGVQISGLEEKVQNLQHNLEQRIAEMDTLKAVLQKKDFEIAQLNTVLDSLEYKARNQEQTISNQRTQLNTAYLVSGSYEELSAKGILTKEGGFLGIGKRIDLQEQIADSSFNKVNILETKQIPVYAGKATLITEHPAQSYEFVTEDEEIAYLAITNPKEFWRISKYAVVETK
ncbi:MAG: hypothetical protein GVY19_11900 [Bacteroidetes bacterium]|jgi:Tfp pilus assembly protein PilO|nr:hypothetical protein [Bacteroidota bacterium]